MAENTHATRSCSFGSDRMFSKTGPPKGLPEYLKDLDTSYLRSSLSTHGFSQLLDPAPKWTNDTHVFGAVYASWQCMHRIPRYDCHDLGILKIKGSHWPQLQCWRDVPWQLSSFNESLWGWWCSVIVAGGGWGCDVFIWSWALATAEVIYVIWSPVAADGAKALKLMDPFEDPAISGHGMFPKSANEAAQACPIIGGWYKYH